MDVPMTGVEDSGNTNNNNPNNIVANDANNGSRAACNLDQLLIRISPDHTLDAYRCYAQNNVAEYKEFMQAAVNAAEMYFQMNPDHQVDNFLRRLLKLAASYKSVTRMKWMFQVISYFIEKKTFTPKMICENIVNCFELVHTNKYFWIISFKMVHSCIKGLDYKVVREIMKACFEKSQTLPPEISVMAMPQVNALEQVLITIFDRRNCMLPAYFVINEILKPHQENQSWPYWKYSPMMCEFVESFRPTAQMVSVIGHGQMLPVVEHSGYSDHLIAPWKLDPNTYKFNIKGNIPYDKSFLQPQMKLLLYVLEQPYSRDMACSMIGLQKSNKHHCAALEEQLVEMMISAMEKVDPSDKNNDEGFNSLWLHISSQLIYFVLFQFASFHNIVEALYEKLSQKDLRKGRDHLMWVLLQFISGSIQRKPLDIFTPVVKLYNLLYDEKEALPVPDINKPLCTYQMAVTCIWIHLLYKAITDKIPMPRPIPNSLKIQYDYLQQQICLNTPLTMGPDYKVALLCNAFSTNNELLSRPMAALVDSVLGSQRGQQVATQSNMPSGPTTPLSMSILDSLTIHAKMSLIHSIVTYVIKLAQSKSNTALAPAVVETYSRLLVYTEIESLGIKGFISQLLPTVFKSHAWGILYTLLEMFSYRMHHIQPHYRVQLLSHLHSLAVVPQTNQTQLHSCVESTALRLITGLGNNEVQPQLSRFLSEPKTLVSSESEELNRALVLTLGRSMHITGTGMDSQSGVWCKELLNTIMQNTPHGWAGHTLQCFPPFLREYFEENDIPRENKQQLKKNVEEEYRNWGSMTNDNDTVAYFASRKQPLFLCLVWKMILDTDRVTPIVYNILESIGARALSSHLRKFCDYIVFKFACSEEGQQVNKCVDAINSMIWKYNIVTIDRLVLCLTLRTHEGNEAQVCFYIIQLLLFKATDFRARVTEFVKDNSAEHWKQSNWYEKHLAFHRKYPEKFTSDHVEQNSSASNLQSLPVYFGNVCLRFLPVFDIVIHRYLEIHVQLTKGLETLLEYFGSLYKFHDRPVSYLYNTLHYYEQKMRDRHSLKKRLVNAILGSFCEMQATNGSLSAAYMKYMKAADTDSIWTPDIDHYIWLVNRFVDTMSGKFQLPNTDWRFNEFPNSSVYILYITCVELMALPATPTDVANNLLDVIMIGYSRMLISAEDIHAWINCIGLIMSALPNTYWLVLYDRLVDVLKCPQLMRWNYSASPFDMFNFSFVQSSMCENKYAYVLALGHAMWHHAGVGQLTMVPQYTKEKLTPLVRTEEQYLFLCHLIGPFLSRYNIDKSPSIMDLTVELFKALEAVDATYKDAELKYIDPMCDLLYHIKYQYVGNLMKNEVDGIIRKLRPTLQMRLRFIAHLNLDEIQ